MSSCFTEYCIDGPNPPQNCTPETCVVQCVPDNFIWYLVAAAIIYIIITHLCCACFAIVGDVPAEVYMCCKLGKNLHLTCFCISILICCVPDGNQRRCRMFWTVIFCCFFNIKTGKCICCKCEVYKDNIRCIRGCGTCSDTKCGKCCNWCTCNKCCIDTGDDELTPMISGKCCGGNNGTSSSGRNRVHTSQVSQQAPTQLNLYNAVVTSEDIKIEENEVETLELVAGNKEHDAEELDIKEKEVETEINQSDIDNNKKDENVWKE